MTGLRRSGLYPPAGRMLAVGAVLLLVAVLLHAPHVLFGVADDNADFRAHWRWAVEFSEDFRSGILYPRWMDFGNEGLGAVPMLYYAPGYFFANALLSLGVADTWVTMRIVEVLASFAAGFFAFRLFTEYGIAARFALLGAAAVQAAPMVFMIGYYFNGVPWATSFALAVALLFYLYRPGNPPGYWINLPAAVALALLILTHTVSGLMVLITFTVGVVLQKPVATGSLRLDWSEIASWLSVVALGLGLSSVYLLPALASLDLAATEAWAGYKPHQSFVFSTFSFAWHGMHWMGFQWLLPLAVLPGLVIATSYYWHWRELLPSGQRRVFLGALIIAWSAVFFATEASYPLWMLDTPLLKVMFPWRFLYVLAATGVVATLLSLVSARGNRQRVYARLTLAALLLPLGATLALSFKLIVFDGRPQALADAGLGPYKSVPEYVFAEKRSDGVKAYLRQGGLVAHCREGNIDCRVLPQSDGVRRFRVTVPAQTETARVLLPIFGFPAWRFVPEDGGARFAPEVDAETGLLVATVPPGEHVISVVWQRLPQEVIGGWVSLVSAMLLTLLAGLQGRGRRLSPPGLRRMDSI